MGYNRNISKLMTFIFRNRTIFWDISKWNKGQKKVGQREYELRRSSFKAFDNIVKKHEYFYNKMSIIYRSSKKNNYYK